MYLINSARYNSISDVIEPNTYIGGLAASYPDKASLASKLGINSSDITHFVTNGNDIEAIIEAPYEIGSYGFYNNQSLTFWKDFAGNCFQIQGWGLMNCENLFHVSFPGLTTGNGYNFAETELLLYLYLPNMTTISNNGGGGVKGSRFMDDSNIEIIDTPLLTGTGRYAFYADGSSKKKTKYLYLPAWRNPNNYGDTFFNINPACKCYFDPFLQTSNNGNEDNDVAYLRARGCTIIYIQNFTPPGEITDLAYTAGNITFTEPSSLNGIERYFVFINGIYSKEIPGSGASLTVNPGDKIEVRPVDIYFNKSTSNIIEI